MDDKTEEAGKKGCFLPSPVTRGDFYRESRDDSDVVGIDNAAFSDDSSSTPTLSASSSSFSLLLRRPSTTTVAEEKQSSAGALVARMRRSLHARGRTSGLRRCW